MKRIIIWILLVSILSSCGIGARYELTGSSENWEILYTVEESAKKNVTGTGTLEYTGEEPVPETFDYMIHYKGNGSGTTGNELSNRKVHFGNFRCESCYFDESDELEVEVMWTGGKETIILNTDNE